MTAVCPIDECCRLAQELNEKDEVIRILREWESKLTDRICVTMMENAELRAENKRLLSSVPNIAMSHERSELAP